MNTLEFVITLVTQRSVRYLRVFVDSLKWYVGGTTSIYNMHVVSNENAHDYSCSITITNRMD